jgi:D-aspartate ligase
MAVVDTSTPVVVLRLVRGSFPHGSLGVVRTLGRLGVATLGFHDDRWAPAAFSRYDRGKLVVQLDSSDAAAAVAYLLELGRGLGTRSILIATEDVSAFFIDDNAEVLRRYFTFPKQPRGLARSLANKRELYLLCRELDVPTPEATFPESRDDVHGFLRSATFPVMVKSIDPEDLQKRRRGKSTVIVHSPYELMQTYEQMDVREKPSLMLQEYIPGDLSAHWMVSAYFNEQSECLVAFTGQKLRESRPGAGFTTLGVCVRNEDVARATCNLLHGLAYRGIVDAEWRYDARDGSYKLLDLNPRVGSQFRAFVATNDMDAVRALYLDLTGQSIPPTTMHEGRKWVVENYDAVASALYWRRGGLSLKTWMSSLRGIQEAAWFAEDDPAPFWVMCMRVFLQTLRRVTGRDNAPLRLAPRRGYSSPTSCHRTNGTEKGCPKMTRERPGRKAPTQGGLPRC